METVEEKNVNFVYMDLQGFRSSGDYFILKELCLLAQDYVFHDFIKSPFEYKNLSSYFKRQADWLTYNFHGLRFDDDGLFLKQIVDSLFPLIEGKVVIVKGMQKIDWIQNIFKKRGHIECLNIEEVSDDSSFKRTLAEENEYIPCSHHRHLRSHKTCHCARAAAEKIREMHTTFLKAK